MAIDQLLEAYYREPEVNVHANATLTCVLAAIVAATGSYVTQRLGFSSETALGAAVVANQFVQWVVPSVLHYRANRHVLSDTEGSARMNAAKSIAHFHLSGIVPGLVYNGVAIGGQYMLAEHGFFDSSAAMLAYTFAIVPSRLAHHWIGHRTGLFAALQRRDYAPRADL